MTAHTAAATCDASRRSRRRGSPLAPLATRERLRTRRGRRRHRIVDLFAGPGGWDVAALTLDLPVLGIELDSQACKTRRAAGLPTLQADVTALDPVLFGPLWGLIASPPCQAFSMAGKGAGRAAIAAYLVAIKAMCRGELVDVAALNEACSDPRAHLVLEPLRWALATRPAWIALEQVPPVLPVWEAMAAALRDLGYSVWTGCVTAEQYGVPQTRRRAILTARRGGGVSSARATGDASAICRAAPAQGRRLALRQRTPRPPAGPPPAAVGQHGRRARLAARVAPARRARRRHDGTRGPRHRAPRPTRRRTGVHRHRRHRTLRAPLDRRHRQHEGRRSPRRPRAHRRVAGADRHNTSRSARMAPRRLRQPQPARQPRTRARPRAAAPRRRAGPDDRSRLEERRMATHGRQSGERDGQTGQRARADAAVRASLQPRRVDARASRDDDPGRPACLAARTQAQRRRHRRQPRGRLHPSRWAARDPRHARRGRDLAELPARLSVAGQPNPDVPAGRQRRAAAARPRNPAIRLHRRLRWRHLLLGKGRPMTDCAYCSPPYRPCICGGGDPPEARHPDPESCGICNRPLYACRCLEQMRVSLPQPGNGKDPA